MTTTTAPITTSDLRGLSTVRGEPERIPAITGPGVSDTKFTDEKPPSLPEIPVPGQILFAPLDGRLRFKWPFTVTLERFEGKIVARISELEEFGIGPHIGDALHDLGRSVIELYFSLKALSDEHVSTHLKALKTMLSDQIEERHESPRV